MEILHHPQSAFVVRIAPSGLDYVPEALANDEIIIGWARAAGLLASSLDWTAFRQILADTYYRGEPTMHGAGGAAGHMWRFIREMKSGDLVVVPYGSDFYVAEISGPATYDPNKVAEDASYRRKVRWLNEKKAIPRQVARSALISRMKTQGTTADATDLVSEIKECLALAKRGHTPSFQADLQQRLVAEVLAEIRGGRMDSYGFERLIQGVLLDLGAQEADIIARSLDKGADIVARFLVAGAFQQVVAVQAKHYQATPPVESEVVDQLVRGMEAESADLGMVITAGTFSESAVTTAKHYYDQKALRIELVDGEQFATLIVEHGLKTRKRN